MHPLRFCTSLLRPALTTFLLAGTLLALPAIADADSIAGQHNRLTLVHQGDENQAVLEQVGELNNLNLLIYANNVSANILQQGNANLVSGINGSSDFTMSGDNSLIDIVQSGQGNQVYGMQLSAHSTISVSQLGNRNSATIIQL